MNICVICGEKYEDGMKNCPICGCQKYTISQLGFPEMLEEQYVPAEMTIGSGRRRYVSLINKETGEAILAGRFLPEEIQLQDLVEKQERESAPELPEVFKTIRNTSGMIFFFEKVPGVTLGELAQQEYPLNEENIFHVMDFTRQQLKQLSKRGFFLGQTDLYSCGITETEYD